MYYNEELDCLVVYAVMVHSAWESNMVGCYIRRSDADKLLRQCEIKDSFPWYTVEEINIELSYEKK